MKHWMWMGVAALGLASISAAEPADPYRAWVAQLNDDSFEVREEAGRKLTEAGAPAVEALVEGITSDQAEVAWRSGAALEQIGLEGDEKTIELIVKHLDAARAKTGRDGLKSLAGDLYARQKQFRRDRAVAKIREHGGQIAGSGIAGGADMAMGMGGLALPVPVGGADVFIDGPVIVEDFGGPIDAMPLEMPVVEVFEAADEVGKGLFGGVARAIAKALIPEPAIPPVPIPVAPEPPAVEPVPAPADEPALEGGEAADKAARAAEEAAKDAAEEAARAADEAAREIKEATIEAADVEPAAADAPAAEGIDKVLDEGLRELKEDLVPEPADVDVDVVVDEIAVADVAAVDFAVVGGMMGMGMPGVEGVSWAQLALDHNWRGGDDALSVLTDLPELSQISLREAPITDKALAHFARLPRLGMIDIAGGKLTRAGLLKFHKQRPNVTVYCRGEALMGVNADFSTSPLVLSAVSASSGAADAGLAPGDVIHTIDGAKIRDFSDLTICVATAKPGDKLKVEYERGGKKETVEVTLGARNAGE